MFLLEKNAVLKWKKHSNNKWFTHKTESQEKLKMSISFFELVAYLSAHLLFLKVSRKT